MIKQFIIPMIWEEGLDLTGLKELPVGKNAVGKLYENKDGELVVFAERTEEGIMFKDEDRFIPNGGLCYLSEQGTRPYTYESIVDIAKDRVNPKTLFDMCDGSLVELVRDTIEEANKEDVYRFINNNIAKLEELQRDLTSNESREEFIGSVHSLLTGLNEMYKNNRISEDTFVIMVRDVKEQFGESIDMVNSWKRTNLTEELDKSEEELAKASEKFYKTMKELNS